jgi:DNA-binding Lrp family transcriptional regulator
MLNELDKRIINELQGGFPICDDPFALVARRFDIDEQTLISNIRRLLDLGILSRFGPMYHAERLGGGLTLCATAVPDDRFEEVAQAVNQHAAVAHNYEREHELNMWFVLATEDASEITSVIAAIEAQTGCKIYNMPKIEEFYVGLRLAV